MLVDGRDTRRETDVDALGVNGPLMRTTRLVKFLAVNGIRYKHNPIENVNRKITVQRT